MSKCVRIKEKVYTTTEEYTEPCDSECVFPYITTREQHNSEMSQLWGHHRETAARAFPHLQHYKEFPDIKFSTVKARFLQTACFHERSDQYS